MEVAKDGKRGLGGAQRRGGGKKQRNQRRVNGGSGHFISLCLVDLGAGGGKTVTRTAIQSQGASMPFKGRRVRETVKNSMRGGKEERGKKP